MRRSFRLLPLLAVVGCVPQAAPPPAPAPVPVAPPPAAPAPLARDWRDWPVTPGDWTYRRDARGTVAMFGPRGADAAMVLRCDAARRQMFVSFPGASATNATVRTSSVARVLPLTPTGGTPPYVAAALAPTDSVLDAMAFSRGRFAVEGVGATPLVAPAWAEIGRVVEDCRG
ncbi:hypothetical protein SAMN05192583_1197 [Sphingomonas gellani]|uniref:Lipoprotein n=1 Tax=Sphingomonas gellani TaxID=1166340 RepID=A0A1H8B4B1_9SPHN|nr:hypothetical protein [Sphingomonas gellani]SEM77765.1 hypothetical protein SAMN05192583_1197 [Sphingomonas gellani]